MRSLWRLREQTFIFKLLDEEPEVDNGYVTLVNAKEENGKLVPTDERTGHWAWKHTHQADGTTDYVEVQGNVVFNQVFWILAIQMIRSYSVKFQLFQNSNKMRL